MTEDEKRQQKAMLLLEYQEAEENLAHLREKAGRMSAPFATVAKWLERAQSGSSMYRIDQDRTEATIRANLASYQNQINFDEALLLMNEIDGAEKKLKELATRKQSLGLK